MRALVFFAAGLLAVSACTSKQEVMAAAPIVDRVFAGDYLEAATCTHNAIQMADLTIQPTVSFIPGRGWAEVQTTATSGYTGTVYGQVSRFEDIDGQSFRAVVRAPWRGDGAIAVEALKSCTVDLAQ